MAKLFKHFGIGGKKAPPHPPRPDYSTQKSSSVQELLTKSPTRDRSTTSLCTAASHFGEFGHDHPRDHHSSHGTFPGVSQDSGPGPGSCSTLPGEAGMSYGGARPKDSRNLSPKEGRSDTLRSTATDQGEEGDEAGPNPQLLDEYSDPFDLKRQLADNPELLGACAPTPVAEDDYSVPYEVKKLIKEMKLRNGTDSKTDSQRKGPKLYDDPYEESPAELAAKARYTCESQDIRPKEDYDEPWEWSVKQKMLLQQMESMSAGQGTPLMQAKKQVQGSGGSAPGGKPGGSGGEKPASTGPDAADNHNPDGDDYEKHEYEKARVPGEEEEDEAYTHLRDEFGSDGPIDQGAAQPAPAKNIPAGNYEEPWDLCSIQEKLEDKLKEANNRAGRIKVASAAPAATPAAATGSPKAAAATGSPKATAAAPSASPVSASVTVDSSSAPVGGGQVKAPGAASTAPAAAAPSNGAAPPHESDDRTQEGYEKPWDWKPHKKDDRGQEGYEKPWDWKPHQKDDRPTSEYEEPWDHKAKEIENELMQAKSAKEAAKQEKKEDQQKAEDMRPPDEYDEPWDQKKNRLASMGGEGSSQGAVAGPNQSPKKKHKLNLDLGCQSFSAVGERVDPKLPLDQQGWYHGSISRVDAENLLRVHREGSYLVRMSESNKLDFSLSLKSARGFMHMKIVHRVGCFILGQFSQPFDSIPMMIHHYSISKLPIKGAEHMSLLHPIINELL